MLIQYANLIISAYSTRAGHLKYTLIVVFFYYSQNIRTSRFSNGLTCCGRCRESLIIRRNERKKIFIYDKRNDKIIHLWRYQGRLQEISLEGAWIFVQLKQCKLTLINNSQETYTSIFQLTIKCYQLRISKQILIYLVQFYRVI